MFWVQPCVSLFWTAILCKPKIGHVKDISQVKRLWDLSQKNQDNFLCTLGVFSKSRIEVRVALIGPFGTPATQGWAGPGFKYRQIRSQHASLGGGRSFWRENTCCNAVSIFWSELAV